MQLRSLLLFNESIRSKATRDLYNYHLKQFKNYYKLKHEASMLEIDSPKLQEMLEDYLFHMKRKELSRSYCNTTFSALELLCILNDSLGLNWKKIRKMFPASKKPSGQKAWSTNEIQRMLNATTELRTKMVIHILADSWARIGALPDLKIRNLIEMPDGCMAIQFYEGEDEEYWGFVIPEGSQIIRDYLDERRAKGENVSMDHPLIREWHYIGIVKPRHMAAKSITGMIKVAIKNAKIKRIKVNSTRFQEQIDHGFRKRGETIMKNNAYKTKDPLAGAKIEKMLGREVMLDGVYYLPDRRELFDLYKEAIPELTISDSVRILAEKNKADAENKDLKTDKELMRNVQKDLEEVKLQQQRHEISNTEKVKSLIKQIEDLKNPSNSDRKEKLSKQNFKN